MEQNFTKSELSTFAYLQDKVESLCREIIKYAYTHFPDDMEYDDNTVLDDYTVGEDKLTIIYRDCIVHCLERGVIEVPISEIINGTWKEYLSTIYKSNK